MKLPDSWFDSKPTFKCLLDELRPKIEALELNPSHQPAAITLSKKYSHRAIRKVTGALGYTVVSKKFGLKFRVKKI